MRAIFLIFSILLTSVSVGQSISSKEWVNDVNYLQNIIHKEYLFLFKKISKEQFDNQIASFKDKIPSLKEHEIKVGIAELIALFGYGHTVSWLTSWRYNDDVGFHQLPLNFYAFKDGIYIQGTHEDYKDILGAKVLKVGNLSVEDALETIRPVVSAENDQFFKAHGINYLGVPEVLHAKKVSNSLKSVWLEVEKNGKRIKREIIPIPSLRFPGKYNLVQNGNDWLEARKNDERPLWIKNLDKYYYYEYLPDSKTVYVRQSRVQDDPNQKNIENFYSEVFSFIEKNDVERMILDLRQNSGGNNYKNKPVILGLIKSKINQKGKLYVVLGRRTFSACQNLVNEIENYTNAIFVGEPTAENVNFFGDVNILTLPNSKFKVRLSHAWWQDKDPRDKRQWTKPSIPVELSFKDYYNNYDPTINTIITASKTEIRLDELLNKETDTNLISKIKQLQSNKKLGFYNFQNWINGAGYICINSNNARRAFKLFKLNSELYPNSPNVWDSLAEGYWRTGNREKARELYHKVIKMAPNSRVAQHSQIMLNYMNREKSN